MRRVLLIVGCLVMASSARAEDSPKILELEARIANLETRLLAAEVWGHRMGGYVPPVAPLSRTVPPGTTATTRQQQGNTVVYKIMPVKAQPRRGILAKLFGARNTEEGGGCEYGGCGCKGK